LTRGSAEPRFCGKSTSHHGNPGAGDW
jgi:hypothetical protein